MSLPIERARSRKPVTWLTLIGVLLLPVVIGGILVASLYNPAERLEQINAAIVNDDEPVTIDDQLVPLGRQLTAGLVEGSDELDSNLTWTLSNTDDAADGLADGTYDAIVTIPENFSAAATSTRPGETPEQATIEVETAPDALIVDSAITAQVTQAAASLMGDQISQVYLENVFLGFTTLGDQLGEAATGARELADGAQQASDGAAQLPGGATQLADGASGISSGATSLAGGLDRSRRGSAAPRAARRSLPPGSIRLLPACENQQLKDAANSTARYAGDAAAQTAALALTLGNPTPDATNDLGLAQQLGALAAQCGLTGESPTFCQQLGGIAAELGAAAADAGTAATSAGYASGYATPTASGIADLMTKTSEGLTDAAGGARGLASGLDQLQSGTTQSADGARQLATGAAQLGDGGTSSPPVRRAWQTVSRSSPPGPTSSPPVCRPRRTRSRATPTPRPPASPTSCRTRSPPRATPRACSESPRSRCSRQPRSGSAGSPRSWRCRPSAAGPSPRGRLPP